MPDRGDVGNSVPERDRFSRSIASSTAVIRRIVFQFRFVPTAPSARRPNPAAKLRAGDAPLRRTSRRSRPDGVPLDLLDPRAAQAQLAEAVIGQRLPHRPGEKPGRRPCGSSGKDWPRPAAATRRAVFTTISVARPNVAAQAASSSRSSVRGAFGDRNRRLPVAMTERTSVAPTASASPLASAPLTRWPADRRHCAGARCGSARARTASGHV